ncbi:MAG: methionine adenosyltransferase domain-containing protein [Rhodopirellula sp.]|nr:methionine adenosyltransferase domain-containing protein [Rhodopirellula sp.]
MPATIYAAEYVLPGHPDKLCDAIADALVELAARREKRALCGVEVAVHRATVFVTGRIACRDAARIDVPEIVRQVYASAGYDSLWRPSPEELAIRTDLCLGSLNDGEADFRSLSDDQSIVTGYAVDLPGTNYLPPEHWLAARSAQRLRQLRTERPELQLGPDGKVFVLLKAEGGCSRLAGFSTSLHHAPDADPIEFHRAVLDLLRGQLAEAAEAIPGFDPAIPEAVNVNGAGNFVVGGPEGDNGLSGKKLVVDAYGPRVAIGGGALCGKDFFKADRAGAILARRLTKAVVLTGAARECVATLAFLPGASKAKIVSLCGDGGQELDEARWGQLLDLSLEGLGERYALTTSLADIARWGHFTDADRPWEKISFDAG